MSVDDSVMYSGIDSDPIEGMFGNESKPKEVERLLQEQDKTLKELTPKLQSIIDMIEAERKDVIDGIAEFIDNSLDSKEVVDNEIKAAARYRKYLDMLKTKFALALGETLKGKE